VTSTGNGAASRQQRYQETKMFQEAREAPEVVARQLEANRVVVSRIAARLKAKGPRAVVTGARGSSDHVATFAKYLIETKTGTLTSSAGLSVSSVYTARPQLDDVLFLAISQSGKSPDLLASVDAARAAGAFIVAVVNDAQSPLARAAHEVIPLHAGIEKSVAATKTYLASAAAIVDVVSSWTDDGVLKAALAGLPAQMAEAFGLDWSEAVTRLKSARDLYVVGRGLGFGAAQEAALKFKETCGLHAEAFSAAELHHGPMALVKDGFPVLMLSQNDETRAGMDELAARIVTAKADVLVAGFSSPGATQLPTIAAHPALEPILMAQSFYRMVNALSLARGFDPDQPPNLNKITETV
jgi:glucosamine--fructose-6-phosphate aminotransferase (isomerizing)